MNWTGKTYWLVGASEGLGREVAKKVVRQGCQTMLEFEADTGSLVNRVKSGLVASDAQLGAELELEATSLGLRVLPDLQDLGVVQGVSEAAAAAAGERWGEACHRFGRLERVPLGVQQKGVMGAASCLGVGVYAVRRGQWRETQ